MNKSGIILLSGLALVGAKDLFAQNSVSGNIINLFTNQPIQNAYVQVEGFGSDSTDVNGFYDIQQTGISPRIIIPNKALPDKLQIVNILGQRIFDGKVSLDNLVGDNLLRVDNLQNVASGMYPFRILDENNNIYASGLIPIVEGSNISLVPFSKIEPQVNGGRSIQNFDSYAEFIVDAEGHLLRESYIEEPDGNITRDEGLVPNATSEDLLFIEFFNDVCGRNENYGTKIWEINPTAYIDTTEMNTGDPATQLAINNYLNALTNLNEFTLGKITGNSVLCDTLPEEWEDKMFKFWDYTIPFNGTVGGVWNSVTNEIYFSGVSIKFFDIGYGTYLQEVTQATMLGDNSMLITPSVFNSGGEDEYQECDLKVGKWLYSRPPNNKVPDKDSFPN